MTIVNSLALFLVMVGLAALPSSSVLLVIARSLALDVKNGLATAVGIVAGDLIFVALAVAGMATLAEEMGALFTFIKYLAGAYLIWLGIGLLRSRQSATKLSQPNAHSQKMKRSLAASFAAGLLLTLGDIKAIFFYASLLPSFLDLASLTPRDLLIVVAVTILAVGGVKAAYAVAAGKASSLTTGLPFERQLKLLAGAAMICAGLYLMVRD